MLFTKCDTMNLFFVSKSPRLQHCCWRWLHDFWQAFWHCVDEFHFGCKFGLQTVTSMCWKRLWSVDQMLVWLHNQTQSFCFHCFLFGSKKWQGSRSMQVNSERIWFFSMWMTWWSRKNICDNKSTTRHLNKRFTTWERRFWRQTNMVRQEETFANNEKGFTCLTFFNHTLHMFRCFNFLNRPFEMFLVLHLMQSDILWRSQTMTTNLTCLKTHVTFSDTSTHWVTAFRQRRRFETLSKH